jgi:starvation-inducible outer membrane lipoprotein
MKIKNNKYLKISILFPAILFLISACNSVKTPTKVRENSLTSYANSKEKVEQIIGKFYE